MRYVCLPLFSQAGADKLTWEMADFGFPPVFPIEVEEEKEEVTEVVIKDKTKGKKVGFTCCSVG